MRWSVVLRGGGAVLWQGDLWVARGAQSSWRQQVQEPGPEECGGNRFMYDSSGRETSVSLMSHDDGREEAPILRVTARWARPGAEPCSGIRKVELEETVPAAGPGPVVLSGDGGLTVELRRR